MKKIEQDHNDLDIEITDLDPIEENSTFASVRITLHTFLTKIPWQQMRVPLQRIVLSLLILLSLGMGIFYIAHPKSVSAHECMRQQLKVVYVAKETVTSAGTTITEVAVPVPSNPKWLYDIKCA